MPYIVTTKRQRPLPVRASMLPACASISASTASRRAVPTLEGKHLDSLWREVGIDPRYWNEATLGCLGLLNLPESGGTVGPLPDGTVIEVEQIEWPALGVHHWNPDASPAQILDAYNARQS